jgi:hypothetical protein
VRADMTAIVRDDRKAGDAARGLSEIHRPFWFLSTR